MSHLINTAAALVLLGASSAASADGLERADAAIAPQGNAAVAALNADMIAELPLTIALPALDAPVAEGVALGYLIAAQGDAALERVANQLPEVIQAHLALPELTVTTRMASVDGLELTNTDI